MAGIASLASAGTTIHEYQLAVSALRSLPDQCAADVEDLANRIGAHKLTLIGWLRADLQLARLAAAKIKA